jgi:hypothetical protein
VERGDTGLGRDAYGLPRRHSRHAYDPDAPVPPEDGYPASFSEYEDDEAAAAAARGEPAEIVDGDYGQLQRRPGEMSSHQQRGRDPENPPLRPPGHFIPNLSPTLIPDAPRPSPVY